jgi:hypothetical protein
MKAQERLIYSKEQELIAKRSEGAPQSELIALQGQIDAERDNLKLKQSELPLAQRSLDLANDGIADAQRAQEESENLFGQQQANLNLQQEIDREQALQFDREEDENDRFERSQEGVTQRDVQRARSLTGRRTGVSAGETRRSTPIAEQMDVSAFKLIDSLDALTNVIEENESNAIGVPTVDGSVDSPIPRALGGPVSPGQSYIVGERRPELFVPRVPGTIVPRVPQMNGFSANLSKVESLLTQLANRPVPTVNAPTTFINQPNPLQTQIELLQGQLRVARGSL